jgi:hypothetical protein
MAGDAAVLPLREAGGGILLTVVLHHAGSMP